MENGGERPATEECHGSSVLHLRNTPKGLLLPSTVALHSMKFQTPWKSEAKVNTTGNQPQHYLFGDNLTLRPFGLLFSCFE